MILNNATTFSEWLVRRAGQIATCVESSEMVVDYMVTGGRIPVSVAEDNALADDLLARGQASPGGATDSVAASEQMTRLGIPNKQYGADWFAANDFVPVVQAALARGVPVLFGLYNASALYDDWTHSAEDGGVQGHGITIVGEDNTGAICADPNTVQATKGEFVHYSWDDLRRAGGSFPSMVIPEGVLVLQISDVSAYFKDLGPEANGDRWQCINGFVVQDVILDFFRSAVLSGGWLGLPLANEFSVPAPAGKKTPWVQPFERGIVAQDPDRVLDSPPGVVGMCYLMHITDSHNPAVAALTSQVAQDKTDIAGLEAEIAKLGSAKTPADIVAALQAAQTLLAPFSAASAEVATALKEVVS